MDGKYRELVEEYIDEGLDARRSIDPEAVLAAVKAVSGAIRKGNKLIVFGNGGSAADALHIVGEFIGLYTNPKEDGPNEKEISSAIPAKHRLPISAIALTGNVANITAIANDYSFEEVYARQLEGLGREGDVALAISTSGNSNNVIAAVRKAKEIGIYTIGLSGKTGGRLAQEADMTIRINSKKTSIIQEAHLTVCHLISILVEVELFGK